MKATKIMAVILTVLIITLDFVVYREIGTTEINLVPVYMLNLTVLSFAGLTIGIDREER
jgi:hypothetical protein